MIVRRQAGVHPALVDLAFVLVFMFLILSTLADPEQRTEGQSELSLPPLNLPELDVDGAAASGVAPAQEIVSLLADGRLLLGDAPVSDVSELATRLADAGAQAVLLRVESSVAYGRVAELLGLCQEQGIEEVSLMYESGTN